jgi:caffeoyl-CoA O-methyltransferase
MDIVDPAIEEYAEQHTTAETEALAHAADETRAHLDSPQMMVGPVAGRFLQTLVFATQASRVLEIGGFSGYSAISMAGGLPEGGKITSCEIDPERAAVARRHIEHAGFADRVDVVVGPALETISNLEGPFDLVFIDANKEGYIDYYEAVLPLLADTGLIVADNTLWSGRVLDDGDVDEGTAAIKGFNEHVVADERTVNVQLTVRDGMTLIRKA